MAIKYLAGERMIGTAAERAALSGSNLDTITQTSWKEIARTTLSSNGDTITVNNIPARDNLMIIINVLSTSGSDQVYGQGTFNNDTSGNYANRWSSNGGSDTSEGSASSMRTYFAGSTTHGEFGIMKVRNIASEEKLCEIYGAGIDTNGAGTAPKRREIVCKWANTSNQITRFDYVNGGSADFATGSEIVVLGCDDDEADSGTNFWQELATVTVTENTNTPLNLPTFATKKYLWVEHYINASTDCRIGLGTGGSVDSNNNYATRYYNGTSENTLVNFSAMLSHNSVVYGNVFIRNLSDKEKIYIQREAGRGSAGAGNAMNRQEFAGKWVNTSGQINILQYYKNNAVFYPKTTIKVWGSD